MKKRVAFYTLGCKVNSAESDVLAATFQKKGYSLVEFDQQSDIYVVNTCTVTHQADSQCRKVIRGVRRRSPEAFVAVMGCYAQADPMAISRIPGVDLILGNREKFSIFDHLNNNSCNSAPLVRTGLEGNPFESVELFPYDTNRTRAFLKVQDGCSYKCSYCIIPAVRGRSVCRPIKDVVRRVEEIRDGDYKEIVLTAVNLGEYSNGSDYKLIDLLDEICNISNVPRIRLTSIEPNCLTKDLVKFIANSDVICHHFHVPLQSGSDTILRSMRRKYLSKNYARVMEWIRSYMPDAAIGADVMVGFPGETESLFEESANFVRDMPITYLHVFRYSRRSGTAAEKYGSPVPAPAARQRSQEMINIGLQKKNRFLISQLGKTGEVLFESKRKDGGFTGFSRNYLRVGCEEIAESNIVSQIHLARKCGMTLMGTIASN